MGKRHGMHQGLSRGEAESREPRELVTPYSAYSRNGSCVIERGTRDSLRSILYREPVRGLAFQHDGHSYPHYSGPSSAIWNNAPKLMLPWTPGS